MASKKQSKLRRTTFSEQYEVCLDYKKPDGYWVCNHKEQVGIQTKHGENEKCQHDKAMAMALEKFPGCRINSVTYC